MLTRFAVGIALGLFGLLATFEPRLAAELFKRAFIHDQFKLAFRRASFYGRRSWIGLNISKDMVFVFCIDLRVSELLALRRFLARREGKFAAGLIATELTYISAALVIETVGTPTYDLHLDRYAQDVDKALEAIKDTPAIAKVAKPATAAEFDVKHAGEALRDFDDFMNGIAAEWFVLSGTFLGIVREGDFLKHDYDIDIGVYGDTFDPTDFTQKISRDRRFQCGEFDTQVIFDRDPDGHLIVSTKPVFLKIVHQGGVHIDLFVHHVDANTTWHASSLFRWDNSNFDLADFSLRGTKVKGPADHDRYLSENYGDWRTPKTDFQSAVDTTNQRVVCNPLSVAIFLRRIWLTKRSNPQGARLLMRSLVTNGFVTEADGEKQVFVSSIFAEKAPPEDVTH